jgi:multicomponent Na+:H+ antiporter subunit E
MNESIIVMMRSILLFLILLAFWLLLSGHYTPLIIGFGVISSAFCVWMSSRISTYDDEGLPLHLMIGLPGYVIWLIWQIVIANWLTIKTIFSNNVSPSLFRVRAGKMSEAGLVLYANSITLTPGTVTIKMMRGGLLIHALTPAMADDVKSDAMGAKIRKIDRKPS